MLYRNNTYKPLKGALSIKCLSLIVVQSVFMINNQTTESVFILPNVHNNSFVTQKSIIICTFILAVHCAFLNGPVIPWSDVHSATMSSYPLRFLPKILEPQLLNTWINVQRKICHSRHPLVINNKSCFFFLITEPTRCTNFSNLFLEWKSTCFGQFLSIIGSSPLYTQQWYMSYRFADSLRAGSGWNSIPSWSC